MTFDEVAALPKSEKITLITSQAEHLVKIFEHHAGAIYKRHVEHFVESVKDNGLHLAPVSSLGELIEGRYFYEPQSQTLFIICLGNLDPKFKKISIVYKFFFSNAPLILPHDLAQGEEVEWMPIISKIGNIGQSLSDESTGIVLESSSSVDLINTGGFFDRIFDSYIWENKPITFYAWFPETGLSEAKKIFEGVVSTKDFGLDFVKFSVKDFIFKLRDDVNLDLFSIEDGRISDSLVGSAKRRIYGQVKQVKLAGVDNLLDGFLLTGSVSINLDSKEMIGTDSLFLTELNPGDEIILVSNGNEVSFGIESIASNTLAILNGESRESFINALALNRPTVPYRFLNRLWHIASHKLREPQTTIYAIISENRFKVNNVNDFFVNDQVIIGNDLVSIRGIVGDEIITKNAVNPFPSLGSVVRKIPIQKVFYKDKELIHGRDWTYLNDTEAIIVFNDLAEFNITQERSLGVDVTFTRGSDTITTQAVVDFRSILKPRDWIRKNSIISGESQYYEILEVKEQSIRIREEFSGTDQTMSALIKSVEYLDDDSLITANCLGMELNSTWIKTASHAVRHLIEYDAGLGNINHASFTQASVDADYILSLVIPEDLGDKAPSIRDCITLINESVFGSLYTDKNLNVAYSILNSIKPADTSVVSDDDILSFETQTISNIYNEVVVNFRPFIDFHTGQSTFEVHSFNSGFVDRYIGLKNTLTRKVFLFETDKALIIAQRLALFYSMSSTKVLIKGKMGFFQKSVNDKIIMNFRRMFKRFAGLGHEKFGTITSIKKSQTEVDIEVSDLGNIFNRVASISGNDSPNFKNAGERQKILQSYIVDNLSETPDVSSEESNHCNLIG